MSPGANRIQTRKPSCHHQIPGEGERCCHPGGRREARGSLGRCERRACQGGAVISGGSYFPFCKASDFLPPSQASASSSPSAASLVCFGTHLCHCAKAEGIHFTAGDLKGILVFLPTPHFIPSPHLSLQILLPPCSVVCFFLIHYFVSKSLQSHY